MLDIVVDGPAPSAPVAWELVDLERVPTVAELLIVRLAVLALGEVLASPISDMAAVTPAT